MNSKPLRVWINTLIKKYCPTGIIKRMTLCRDILPWLEKQDELTFWQKVELRFHIFICPPCWDYKKQLHYISCSCKKTFEEAKQMTEKSTKLEKIEFDVIKKNCKKNCACKKED